MKKNYLPRLVSAVAAVVLAIGLSQFADAQTPPAPQPSPSPSPSPSPAPQFQSPFGNPNPGPGEADAFNNLVTLYDKYLAADDNLKKAKACGTKADVDAASLARKDANEAYSQALSQYVQDYSNIAYPPGAPGSLREGSPAMGAFSNDRGKVDIAVRKASKHKPVAIGDCTVPVTTPHPPTPKPHPRPVGGAAAYFGAPFGMSAGTFRFDYAHINPSTGNDGDQWGFSGSGLFAFGQNLGLDIDLGYHNVLSNGRGLNNWTAGASLAWRVDNLRLGPSFGFQSNSIEDYSADTYNYGGYLDYYLTHNLTVSGKGGGFSTSSSDSGFSSSSTGFYYGGQLQGFVTPNFSISGAVDFTHFNQYGGSSETDYEAFLEYLFWGDEDEDFYGSWWLPTSIYAGYTYSDFSQNDFHVSTFTIGLNFYTNGNGANTLVDRQRSGTVENFTTFQPLSLRF